MPDGSRSGHRWRLMAPWGGILAAARFHRPWGLYLSALPRVLILWRRLVLALRASAPTVAVSCGRGPNSPSLIPSGGPVAPPPLPRSLRSRPDTVVGASGDRCPALRGSFVGYRLASFAGAFRVRSCVRRAGRVLRSGRAALQGARSTIARLLGRHSRRLARTPALRPLRPRFARPRPRFSLQGVRIARR